MQHCRSIFIIGLTKWGFHDINQSKIIEPFLGSAGINAYMAWWWHPCYISPRPQKEPLQNHPYLSMWIWYFFFHTDCQSSLCDCTYILGPRNCALGDNFKPLVQSSGFGSYWMFGTRTPQVPVLCSRSRLNIAVLMNMMKLVHKLHPYAPCVWSML